MPRQGHIVLQGQSVAYQLRGSTRRSVGLVLKEDGLWVHAPFGLSEKALEGLLRARQQWILRALSRHHAHEQAHRQAQDLWLTNGLLPYRGRLLRVTVDELRRRSHYQGRPQAPGPQDCLILPPGRDSRIPHLSQPALDWLQHQARLFFQARLEVFLARAGQPVRDWRLSRAKSRWGSCTHQGRILLNWRLIHFRQAIIDYVIAHEVAHLREWHHGPAFWREVRRLLPEYEPAHQALKAHRPDRLPLLHPPCT